MIHVTKKQQGFTLIELMLSLTFIAFLLLAIAMTIIQIGGVYNKGTTLKEINQASRDLSADVQRSIGSAGALTLSTDLVFSPASATDEAHAAGGRLCLGSYSYIWNYARAINASLPGLTKYAGLPVEDSPKLIKVADPSRTYCAKSGSALTVQAVSASDKATAVNLLKAGDHDLGLHHFTFTPPPTSASDAATGQKIYSLSYTIGTSQTSAMNGDQTACSAPNILNADPLYCNIQQFGLVVRTGI